MSVPKLNEADRKTIAELYLKGMYSQRELAHLYMVSRSTVQRAVHDYQWYFDETGEPALHHERATEQWPSTEPLNFEVDRSTEHSDLPPKWFAWGILVLMATTVVTVMLYGLHAALEAVPH